MIHKLWNIVYVTFEELKSRKGETGGGWPSDEGEIPGNTNFEISGNPTKFCLPADSECSI